jgi:DNA polymerase-4
VIHRGAIACSLIEQFTPAPGRHGKARSRQRELALADQLTAAVPARLAAQCWAVTSEPATPPASATALPRRIAHLDMDAFFASVELLRYPQLKGLPVVIGGARRQVDEALMAAQGERALRFIPIAEFPLLKDYVGRGVITTATYAARQFGIGSAMGMMKAARLCPQAIVLPVDFDEIRRFSRLFKSTIAEIAPLVEDRGVDEVYIDFTDVPGGQREGGRVLARLIQKSIFQASGLTCSIGVAPNKLLAKMASEFNKPNGISIVHEADLQEKIWPLHVRKINGIGPKAGDKLAGLGIQTIGELAASEPHLLIQHFGKATGGWMHEAASGRDASAVVTESEPVSMSRETTFERDLHAVRDKAELGAIFTRLCEQVAADLQRKGYVAKTIGIKLRYEDFRIATRDQTAPGYTADAKAIRQLAGQCLKRVPLAQRLRLLGVRAGTLLKAADLPGGEQDRTGAASALAQAGPESRATGQLF